MQEEITWKDCIKKQDELIDAVMRKMYNEPIFGEYWRKRLAVEMLRRQEIVILAKQEEKKNGNS